MTYRELAFVIALAIPIIGYLVELIRVQLRLQGFSEIRRELQTLVKGLSGEFDRDASDLLVRGRYGQWPVLIRFSRSEYEPGISIQIPVPTALTFYCYPVTHEGEEGSVLVRTSDERFMSQFRLSTNNSRLEVNTLLSSPAVLAELSKITNSHSYIRLDERTLEFAEAVIVPEHLAGRLINCVRGMARIAAETELHAGTGPLPVTPRRAPHRFRVAYLGASAIILIVLGVLAVLQRPRSKAEIQATTKSAPPALPEELATQVPQLQGWHVSNTADFDLDAIAWMQQQGQQASGHIVASMNSPAGHDSAYILKLAADRPGANSNRLVLLINNQKRYDAEMPEIAVAGRIRKERIKSVQWRGRGPSGAPNGDGVIVIQRYKDPSSAIIFFMSGAKLLTGVPKDFRLITLE